MSGLTEREVADIAIAKKFLADHGYVVLREKSYRQAQERQRVAECYRRAAEEATESARRWARDCLAAERRIGERCMFLYGAARAAGCTEAELRGPNRMAADAKSGLAS